jgi:hypothetical protein
MKMRSLLSAFLFLLAAPPAFATPDWEMSTRDHFVGVNEKAFAVIRVTHKNHAQYANDHRAIRLVEISLPDGKVIRETPILEATESIGQDGFETKIHSQNHGQVLSDLYLQYPPRNSETLGDTFLADYQVSQEGILYKGKHWLKKNLAISSHFEASENTTWKITNSFYYRDYIFLEVRATPEGHNGGCDTIHWYAVPASVKMPSESNPSENAPAPTGEDKPASEKCPKRGEVER